MPRNACFDCGRPTTGTRCPDCKAKRKKPKKKPEYRSYRGTKAHREMRERVWLRDGGICQRCGKPVHKDEPWDLGHRVAHKDGGEFVIENLQVEHVRGNRGGGECR